LATGNAPEADPRALARLSRTNDMRASELNGSMHGRTARAREPVILVGLHDSRLLLTSIGNWVGPDRSACIVLRVQ
jgi:hypothetical protein